MEGIPRFISVCLFVSFIIIEPTRIYFGFAGNLREKVPELSGCFLLSCFPILPSTIFFVSLQPVCQNGFVLPLEIAVNIVYLVLVSGQVIYSYVAAKKIVRSQAAQFILRIDEKFK